VCLSPEPVLVPSPPVKPPPPPPQEMASKFVPRPLERLLAVVTALLHR
jgi:hypothetical protein